MLSKELNIGRAGEYLAMSDLLLKGFQCFDTGQGAGYDLIAEIDGKLLRIQVKTTCKKTLRNAKPIYFYHIKRNGKNGLKRYKQEDFELFALVALDIKEVFYLANDSNVPTSSISLRDRNTKYINNNASKGRLLYYQDLTFENYLNA
jgi:hypothetical protein